MELMIMVSHRKARGTNDCARRLMLEILDAWNRIKYFHQLIEIDCSEGGDELGLFVDCYLILSEPHREDFERKLKALRKEISAKGEDSED